MGLISRVSSRTYRVFQSTFFNSLMDLSDSDEESEKRSILKSETEAEIDELLSNEGDLNTDIANRLNGFMLGNIDWISGNLENSDLGLNKTELMGLKNLS